MKCVVRQVGFGGGAPLSLFQHYLILKKNGYDQIICMAHGNNDHLQAKYENAFGHIIDTKCSSELWNESRRKEAFLQFRREYRFIRKENPDLVVVLGDFNAALYSYICRKTGIPMIVYIAGGTLRGHERVIEMWQNCEVICFSKENEDEIIRHYAKEHVHVISNRIALVQRFDDIESHYQKEQREIHVLITSRLAEDKIQSIYALIRLLSQCTGEDTHIIVRVAGDGPMKEDLLAFSKEMETDGLTIQYLGHLDDLTEQFRWAHIAAGKGRSVIEPIMMNRIGCIIGEDGKIGFCNEENFENIYHYNFAGRNLETENSLACMREMIRKIKIGDVSNEDVITPSEMTSINYSAEYLPEKLKAVLDILPAPMHKRRMVFLLMRFLHLSIRVLQRKFVKSI